MWYLMYSHIVLASGCSVSFLYSNVAFSMFSCSSSRNSLSLFRRHNNLLNKDKEFLDELHENIEKAKLEYKNETEQPDARTTWEYIKYHIRLTSIKHSRMRICKMKEEKKLYTNLLTELEKHEIENHNDIVETKEKLNQITREEEETIIFRSRVKWVEENEKCTSYFFRNIQRNKEKSNITKLEIEGKITEDKKKINDELLGFLQETI